MVKVPNNAELSYPDGREIDFHAVFAKAPKIGLGMGVVRVIRFEKPDEETGVQENAFQFIHNLSVLEANIQGL